MKAAFARISLPAAPDRRPARGLARNRPAIWLASALLCFALVWLTQLSFTSLSPPTDNIEQLNWVHVLQWGYYKHPPLPTWLVWIPVQLFGLNAWTTYACGAALTLTTMAIFWRLLRRLRGYRYATLALLAVACISYYNARLNTYNHNTVLLFLSTVCAALCWKAWTSAKRRWWAALGIAVGLGFLSKYQIALSVLCILAFWCSQRGWRQAHQRQGLLLAGLTALLMLVPHLQWLRTHDFAPIQYALGSSLGTDLAPRARLENVLIWLADQLLNRALPAWLLLIAARFYPRREPDATAPADASATASAHARAGRALLLCWGLVPLLCMPLMGLTFGSALQMQWGLPFLLFAVPTAMELSGGRAAWSRLPWASALRAFAVIQVLLLILSHVTSARGPQALRDHQWRNFDSLALARQLEAPARQALGGGRICFISGPTTIAGAVALNLPDRPLVLIDGRYDESPWIDAEQVRRCGLLELRRGPAAPGATVVGGYFPDLWWRVVPAAHPTSAYAGAAAPAPPADRVATSVQRSALQP